MCRRLRTEIEVFGLSYRPIAPLSHSRPLSLPAHGQTPSRLITSRCLSPSAQTHLDEEAFLARVSGVLKHSDAADHPEVQQRSQVNVFLDVEPDDTR